MEAQQPWMYVSHVLIEFIADDERSARGSHHCAQFYGKILSCAAL